jgi:type IV pilus assembly protein PilP
MKTNLFISVLLMLFLLSVTGCPKQAEKKLPPKQPVSNVETPKVEAPKEAAKPSEEGYTYNPRGRRDPFKSLLVKVAKIEEELPPLQKVDSADLKLTAIVWDQAGYFAMVETPDGKGFVVKVGTIIGLNKGVVKKITPRELIIEEKVQTYLGELRTREVTLELRKREEGR